MKSRTWKGAALLAVLSLAIPLRAQGDPDVVAKIIEEGKTNNQVMRHLEHLCVQIGHRLTGSSNLQRACDWTKGKFEEFGLKASLEQWGEIPVGFLRGDRQIGRMVSPSSRSFQFTTRSWTAGTNGMVRGEAVMMPATAAEVEANPGKFRGKWLIAPMAAAGQPGGGQRGQVGQGGQGQRGGQGGGQAQGGQQGQGQRPQGAQGGQGGGQFQTGQDPAVQALNAALAKARIAGVVRGARNELVVTSGSWRDLDWNNLPKDVSVTVRRSDHEAITAALGKNEKVVLEFDIEQKFEKGPVPVYNVVADIVGTEKPDEVVIVSGHLDSWDGPGSQGTSDNGTGTMVALEAARILMASGAKPKRTIRFIMWTGEEQGLHGSRRYVEMHPELLPKISAVLVDDGGTNYSGGLVCIPSMWPMLSRAIEGLNEAFPDLPVTLRIQERMPRGGGSDHAPFNAVGVPGFFWTETGVANYNYIHHTQHDSLPNAIEKYLVQSSVAAAVTAFNLASADTLLPREPQAPPAPSN